jgi:hypothetical protein
VDDRKKCAEELSRRINDRIGWRGADPEWSREGGYSGRILLSARAATEVARMLVGSGSSSRRS